MQKCATLVKLGSSAVFAGVALLAPALRAQPVAPPSTGTAAFPSEPQSTAAPAPAPAPAAPVPAPATPTAAAAPPTPAPSSAAATPTRIVRLHTDEPGRTLLQRQSQSFHASGVAPAYTLSGQPAVAFVSLGGNAWETVCADPCGQAIPAGHYRIQGVGFPDSEEFFVGPGGGDLDLHVNSGSNAAYWGGGIISGTGFGIALVGGVILAFPPPGDDPSSYALPMVIGGAVAGVAGLVWMLAGGTTDVVGTARSPNGT